MDATRRRRTRDSARQKWYASSRCRRLARHLGFWPASRGLKMPMALKGPA